MSFYFNFNHSVRINWAHDISRLIFCIFCYILIYPKDDDKMDRILYNNWRIQYTINTTTLI